MAEFCGSLAGIGIPALVGFLADLRRTGCLRLTQGRWTGEVYFDRGQVVAAAFGAEQGPPALAASLLALGQGQFTFAEGAPPPARNVELAGDALQAYLEEAGAAVATLSLAAVPQIVEPAPIAAGGGERGNGAAEAGAVVLDRGTLQTLLAVNGRRTVEDLAAQRGLVRTVQALATLAELGLIRIGPPAAGAAGGSSAAAPAAPDPDLPATPARSGSSRAPAAKDREAKKQRGGFDPNRLSEAQRPAAIIPQIVGARPALGPGGRLEAVPAGGTHPGDPPAQALAPRPPG